MRKSCRRLVAGLSVAVAMIALTVTPVGAQDDFDEEAAREEVVTNLITLFEQLAVAGNPDTPEDEAAAAIDTVAGLVEGGDSDEVREQIPNIAALAFAADLEIVIDEEPTFDEAGTTATYLFSALSGGNPSQVDNANGIHVLEDGTWKLASELWEAFVALGSGASPDDVGDGETGDDGEEGGEDGGAEGGEDGDGEELANTGLNTDAVVVLAGALLGAGAMIVWSTRRRNFV